MATHREIGRHAHPWGQLIYCSSGVMTVWTERGSWVAPPHWAIWAPARVEHEMRFAGRAELRTLYLRADVATVLPATCAVMAISPLLRELILRAVTIGMLDEREPVQEAMARVIVGELATVHRPPFDLPAPRSPATRQAAALLTTGDPCSAIQSIAEAVGLGARTLERRFVCETGMSVASWGRQARLLQSLRLLAAGDAVKSVALAAGYRTPSAFVAAFRAAFGETPARYFS